MFNTKHPVTERKLKTRLVLECTNSSAGGKAGTNYRVQLYCICCVFLGNVIICRLYALTLPHLSQVTLQLTVTLSYLL
jgi:hypothetical protein